MARMLQTPLLSILSLTKLRLYPRRKWCGSNIPWFHVVSPMTSNSVIGPKLTNSHTDSSNLNGVPLTDYEVDSFLSDTLHMKNTYHGLMQDRLTFLNEVLKRFKLSMPGNNLTAISFCTNENLGEDEEAILQQLKQDILSLHGGQCYWFGLFLHALLRRLGYDAQLVGAGDRVYDAMFDMHPAIIVRDLSYDGSLHLIESSPTYPIFEVIPLAFDKRQCVYSLFDGKQKIIKGGKGIVKYCQKIERGGLPRSSLSEVIEEDGNLWEVHVTYRYNTVRSVSHFVELVYFFRSAPRLGAFFHKNLLINGFSRGNWVTIVNRQVTVTGVDGIQIDTWKVSSMDKMPHVVVKYFPQYPLKFVEKCITHIENSRLYMQ